MKILRIVMNTRSEADEVGAEINARVSNMMRTQDSGGVERCFEMVAESWDNPVIDELFKRPG